jgi:hypothetical protein
LQQALRANPASEAAMLALAELGVAIAPKLVAPLVPVVAPALSVPILERTKTYGIESLWLLLMLAGAGIVWALDGTVMM